MFPGAEPVSPALVVLPGVDKFASAETSAASPPCESTIVVMQEFSGSGGSRTRVMIPGTTSEKCLETKVDMSDDFPTPSVEIKRESRNGSFEIKIRYFRKYRGIRQLEDISCQKIQRNTTEHQLPASLRKKVFMA